ncbi:hypothetical protein [Mucisphaera calidilacus]|uniref:Uncharacterized protein n=1 Tax=Mucisphaera calidilacus TaxID=2527982 RepID=A0A518BUU7_9BACT|nr:hypothetical protein [Mucisphaera calidilacus]QDU70760.1 hypothetical protein Pan265_05950 [Mucisphaera calidilacus]
MKPARRQPQDPFHYGDIRRRMIDETSHFLSEAMRGRIRTPRIPARQVSEGGYGDLRHNVMGKLLVRHFWRLWFASDKNPDDDAASGPSNGR